MVAEEVQSCTNRFATLSNWFLTVSCSCLHLRRDKSTSLWPPLPTMGGSPRRVTTLRTRGVPTASGTGTATRPSWLWIQTRSSMTRPIFSSTGKCNSSGAHPLPPPPPPPHLWYLAGLSPCLCLVSVNTCGLKEWDP